MVMFRSPFKLLSSLPFVPQFKAWLALLFLQFWQCGRLKLVDD